LAYLAVSVFPGGTDMSLKPISVIDRVSFAVLRKKAGYLQTGKLSGTCCGGSENQQSCVKIS
jgi:hypothetical protein